MLSLILSFLCYNFLYADFPTIFIDEEPSVEACYRLAVTKNVVVVPYFIGEGLHTVKDIPVMLGVPERTVLKRLSEQQPTWRNPTERRDKRVWYASSIGHDALVAEVILQRVREAAQRGGDATTSHL